jgi:hypothetical protein
LTSGSERPKLLVTLRRDGDDFVVRFYPEDIVVFRHNEPNALRKMCAFLRWKIISDSSGLVDTTIAAFKAWVPAMILRASAGAVSKLGLVIRCKRRPCRVGRSAIR